MTENEKQGLLLRMHEQEIDVVLSGDVHLCFDSEEAEMINEVAVTCSEFEPLSELTPEQDKRHKRLAEAFAEIIKRPNLTTHLEQIEFDENLSHISEDPAETSIHLTN